VGTIEKAPLNLGTELYRMEVFLLDLDHPVTRSPAPFFTLTHFLIPVKDAGDRVGPMVRDLDPNVALERERFHFSGPLDSAISARSLICGCRPRPIINYASFQSPQKCYVSATSPPRN